MYCPHLGRLYVQRTCVICSPPPVSLSLCCVPVKNDATFSGTELLSNQDNHAALLLSGKTNSIFLEHLPRWLPPHRERLVQRKQWSGRRVSSGDQSNRILQALSTKDFAGQKKVRATSKCGRENRYAYLRLPPSLPVALTVRYYAICSTRRHQRSSESPHSAQNSGGGTRCRRLIPATRDHA